LLTVHQRLVPGRVLRAGSVAPYRAVAVAQGEPHTVRTDLAGPVASGVGAGGRPLLTVGHVTDLHVTDVESPARFEFLNRYQGDPRFRELLTMQRPQEALNVHAVEAMVRTLNAVDSAPITGSPLDLVVMTGDAIDNAQANELANFIALFDGGQVTPASGDSHYEGAQASSWPDDLAWKPNGPAGRFGSAYGFPDLPGLLEQGQAAFEACGLNAPWLGCHGNHEQLCQGVGIVTAEMSLAMIAGAKPIGLPEGFDAAAALETFVAMPELFMRGAMVAVTPDGARRPAGSPGFVEAHSRSGGRPQGHGFTAENRRAGAAYYVHDTPAVRLVTLDTACPEGGADGRLDRAQLRWLEDRLAEVHSSYAHTDGRTVRTSHDDRLVVVVSHHPLFTIRNHRAADVVGADEILSVLHRFANVVLWLNGHVHMNMVQAHPGGPSRRGGFWEVTTSSIVDWPCQGRLVEIFDAGRGQLAVGCTIVDHDGKPDPKGATSSSELAGLHRQLAANDPVGGFASPRAGAPADRNVILPMPAPFPLERLGRRA
jgi:metallophosphoesterase (TIGR03767 family)